MPTLGPPEGYKIIYRGLPLPPFLAAEMLRPLIGTTVWLLDDGGRSRHGQLIDVPWVKEDQVDNLPAMTFEDARPFYPKGIVCVAQYQPKPLGR